MALTLTIDESIGLPFAEALEMWDCTMVRKIEHGCRVRIVGNNCYSGQAGTVTDVFPDECIAFVSLDEQAGLVAKTCFGRGVLRRIN